MFVLYRAISLRPCFHDACKIAALLYPRGFYPRQSAARFLPRKKRELNRGRILKMNYIFDSCLLKKQMHYFYTFLEIFFFWNFIFMFYYQMNYFRFRTVNLLCQSSFIEIIQQNDWYKYWRHFDKIFLPLAIIVSSFHVDLHKHNLSRRVIGAATLLTLKLKLFYALGAFRKCAKRKVLNEIKRGLAFVCISALS